VRRRRDSSAGGSDSGSCKPGLRKATVPFQQQRSDDDWGPRSRQDSDEDSTHNSPDRIAARPLPWQKAALSRSEDEDGISSLPEASRSIQSSSILRRRAELKTIAKPAVMLPTPTGRGLAGRRGLQLKLNEEAAAGSTPPNNQGTTPSESNSSEVPSFFPTPSNAESRRRASIIRLQEDARPAIQLLFQTQDGSRGTGRLSKVLTSPDLRPALDELDIDKTIEIQRIPRPLPGAFPSRRSVIFFDWDDTLCPTSWIRSLLKEHLDDMEQWVGQVDTDFGHHTEDDWRDSVPSWFKQPLPDEPVVHELISELQSSCIHAISVAQELGVVCIVTNAFPGWVEKTIKRWLPQLREYVGGRGKRRPIQVLYAQQAYVQGLDEGLSHVDAEGECMWWKKAAIARALDEVDDLYCLPDEEGDASSWCAGGKSKRISNVISIGDSEAEMRAAELACWHFDSRRSAPKRGRQYRRVSSLTEERADPIDIMGDNSGSDSGTSNEPKSLHLSEKRRAFGEFGGGRRNSLSTIRDSQMPWVKLIKLKECSHVRRLAVQLEEIADLLPKMVALRKHLRVDLPEGSSGTTARSVNELQATVLRCNNEDLEVENRLRVETV